MEQSSNGSPNNHKNPIRGFFKSSIKLIKSFYNKKNDTVGTAVIAAVIILFLETLVTRFISSNSTNNSNALIVNDNHTNNGDINIKNYPIKTGSSKTDSRSYIDSTVGKTIAQMKSYNQHLRVSSNLDSISDLLESRLNRLHLKTKNNHIDIEFSPYPSSTFENKGEYAQLDSGAIVKFEIKNTGDKYYIKKIPIPEIQNNFSNAVIKKENEEMTAIVLSHMNFVVAKVRTCLQGN